MLFIPGSDAWAVRRVLAGHPEAFEGLVLRHGREALAVARALGVRGASLEDIVQDAFLQAYRDLATLSSPSRFGPWFLQIARNTARMHLRKCRSAPSVELPDSLEAPAAESLEDKDLREHLRKKVEELPEGIREALFLYYFEGESVGQVARVLSISRAASRKRLQRGRDLLRTELWRELEESLRHMLPSARQWRARAARLAMAVLGSIPFSMKARAAVASLPSSGTVADAAAGTVLKVSVVGIIMGSKLKEAIVVLAILVLISGAGLFTVLKLRENEPERSSEVASAPTPSGQAGGGIEVPRQPPPAAPPEKKAPEAGPAVQVQVEDGEGHAVGDAVVKALWIGEAAGVDAKASLMVLERTAPGEFRLAKRLGSEVVILAAARGFSSKVEKREVPEGGIPEPIAIVLEKGDEIRARLVDPTDGDKPIAGAKVGGIEPDPSRLVFDASPSSRPPPDLDGSSPVRLFDPVETDAEGLFSFSPEPGTIWTEHEGYAPTAVRLYAVQTLDAARIYSIPLYPVTTLRISVLKENGEPVEKFTYAVSESGMSFPDPPFSRKAEGAEAVLPIYTVCHLTQEGVRINEEVTVGVESGGNSAKRSLKVERGEDNPIEVTLREEPGAIFGRVLNPDGNPLATAQVLLAESDFNMFLCEGREQIRESSAVVSGPGGEWEMPLEGKHPPFYVVCRHSEYPVWIGDWTSPPPGKRTRIDIRLERGARILIRMAGGGEAVREGKVDLEAPVAASPAPILDYRRSAKLDAAGQGEINNLPPGVWDLHWSQAKGGAIRRAAVSVLAGKTYEVELGQPEGGETVEVFGVALAQSKPVAGLELWLRRDGFTAGQLLGIAKTDAQGRFSFSRVPPGEHALAPWTLGTKTGLKQRNIRFPVTPGMGPAVVDLTTTALRGRVRSKEGPLGSVEVKPYLEDYIGGAFSWRTWQTVRTDTDGSFRLVGLYSIPYVIVFRKDGFIDAKVEWRPVGEEEAKLPDVVLEPSGGRGVVRFAVTGADRQEVPHLGIDLFSLEQSEDFQVATLSRTEPTGPLEVRGLPSGRYRAVLTPYGAWIDAAAVVEFDHTAVADQEVAVSLQPGGAVRLDLTAEEGLIPGPATMEILDPSGTPIMFRGGEKRLRFEGAIVLVALPVGDLKARISMPGIEPFEVPLRVEAGRTVRISHVVPARQ